MKMQIFKYLILAIVLCGTVGQAEAQKKKKAVKKTTKTKSKAKIQTTAPTEDTAALAAPPTPPVAPPSDSFPIRQVKKSLRPDEAVESAVLRERVPLAYEHLRADDAVYRHRIWREIDTREKINHTFNYSADADNGNQRFFSILLTALQDSTKEITAFNSIDDRFTTPMTRAEIAKAVFGEEVDIVIKDSNDIVIGTKKQRNELNFDSIYRFRIKEEVIFDKESSRLFWRILGIAPVKSIILSDGSKFGDAELFWIYYPDIRPILATYDVYNGKNFGGRMSWEELFESRMFSARIIKSSYDNPRDKKIENFTGFEGNGILQLFEGENIKERIFSYEQDLWSY
jgi:gliding motility associated protien GldN